jgi:serine/threonine-protein kinase RsbT
MADETRVEVRDDVGILEARQAVRALAKTLGFSDTDLTLIATAVSEIARNMVEYGKGGEFVFAVLDQALRKGIAVTAVDHGPGIADISRAMEDGYSGGKGLGLGLPGARRLMDEFEIESKLEVGTTISMVKWVP